MLKKRAVKILISLFVFAVLCLVIIVAGPKLFTTISNSVSISSHTNKAPLMVAHRGLSSLFPQNTLPAFEGAVEYGFDGVECDIHTTKDGKWVIIHDDTVDKMTDGTGNVADFTLKEIQELTIDYGNGIANYKNLKMPTLEQYLEVCENADIIPVIEIKKCEEKYLSSLKEMLGNYNFKKAPVLISFERSYLETYRELDSEIEMLLLATEPSTQDVQWCIDHKAGLNFHFANLARCLSAISMAKTNGIKLAAWTVDNPVYEDVMVLFGIEIITTNKLLP